MQLTTLLLVIVAILTALSGVAVISGAHKGDRLQAFLFFLTTMAALTWAVGIGIFLSLPEDAGPEWANAAINMIYIGAPVMCWGLMAYTCHKYLLGKIGIVVLGVACVVFASLIVVNPGLLYSSYDLNAVTGNIVHVRQDAFYILYGVYHFIAVGLYMVGLGFAAYSARAASVRKAHLMVLVGFSITGVLALVFDFILPYFGKYDTIWVGVFAMSIAWIFHYYAILRYRLLDLSSPWLRGFSKVIVMSLAAIAYLVIFFIIFAALFKVPAPSVQVIILNMLMIVAVMLLFPALNELSTFVGSLASTDTVDVSYIVKKLTKLVGYDVNLTELATFLCDHLHFQYIGFVMDGEVYGSQELKVSPEVIKAIAKLKKSNGGIWMEPDEELAKALKKLDITAVAELRDGKGKVVGQVLFGKSSGHYSLDNRDLVPVEVVMQVVPVVTHPGNYRIKKHRYSSL